MYYESYITIWWNRRYDKVILEKTSKFFNCLIYIFSRKPYFNYIFGKINKTKYIS